MPANPKFSAVALLLTGALAMSACASKAPKALPPAPGPATQAPQESTGPVPGSAADFVAFTQGDNVIYFDTDRYNIDSVDAAALQKQAEWMLRYPNTKARVEGNCDERGTREYNLALGERRAVATKNYLVSLGIGADRLSTISYGKERPVALGSNEEAWAKNRRAVTVVIE